MAHDRQLSPDFRLSEFPCWRSASSADVALLEDTVHAVLQPARDRWGPIRPTSWRWWSAGCTPRVGAHADAGTVDFVPLSAPIPTVHRWIAAALPGTYGELIDERDHIHVTRPGVGAPAGAPQTLVEPSEGVYVAVDPAAGFPGGWGTSDRPFELPGIEVTVGRSAPWAWALAGAVLLLLLDAEGARRG